MRASLWYFYIVQSILLATCQGGLYQLYQMVDKLANIKPQLLLSYGCYCGYGNSNTEKVTDCLDKCCYHHDACIADLHKSCTFDVVVTSYAYDAQSMECDPKQDKCPFSLCQCDYLFGQCVNKNKQYYLTDCNQVRTTSYCQRDTGYSLPNCTKEEDSFRSEVCRKDTSSTNVVTSTSGVSQSYNTREQTESTSTQSNEEIVSLQRNSAFTMSLDRTLIMLLLFLVSLALIKYLKVFKWRNNV